MKETLSFAQKARLHGYNPVVLLRGIKKGGSRFFAYVEMTKDEYELLSAEAFKSVYQYGRVILEGEGMPTDEQCQYMETNYEFDHSNVTWDEP